MASVAVRRVLGVCDTNGCWRHCLQYCPSGASAVALGWLPATPDTTISPVGNGGPSVPLCLVVALTTPSARDHRGACRRRAVPGAPAGRGRPNGHRRGRHRCRCPARASTCSSEPVFPPMRRPSPYDVHVRTPGLAMRCHGCHCAGAGPAHRRPLAAVGRRDDIRRRAMRRCWRLGRPDLHVPWSRERCGPSRWLPLTPHAHGVPPSATEGYRRRCAEVDALPAQVRAIVVAPAVGAQCCVRPRPRAPNGTGVAAIDPGALLERILARAGTCSRRCRGRRRTTRTC